METEGEIDLGGTSLLDNDAVPNANQSLYCFSCETPMQGLYCGACGQKNDDYRRSLTSLVVELFSSLTAIEGRIWRTWGALLFKPGKVAREFADGRRTHWSSPIRVFLAMSLILFGYIAITKTQIISADVNIRAKAGIEKSVEDLTPPDLVLSGALHMFETQKQINARNAERDLDLIDVILNQVDDVDYALTYTDEGWSFSLPPAPGENIEHDTDTVSDDATSALEAFREGLKAGRELKEGGDIKGLEDQGLPYFELNKNRITPEEARQNFKKFIKNPSTFNNEISKNLPRVMFIMMPLTMLIGAMFIRGRGNALLYDHLVHTAYIHSILFFLLFLGLILGRIPWLPGDIITLGVCIYLIFYLPISLRHMFKRSWLKTIWTSYGVASIYSFFMLFIMFFLGVRGVAAQFGV